MRKKLVYLVMALSLLAGAQMGLFTPKVAEASDCVTTCTQDESGCMCCGTCCRRTGGGVICTPGACLCDGGPTG